MAKMSDHFLTLDVREDLRAGREPLARILETVKGLGEGRGLRLIAPFKPVPLFYVLGRMGYDHRESMVETDTWEVLFEKAAAPVESTADSLAPKPVAGPLPLGPGRRVEVDARGLEPPQPLVTILEAVEKLPARAELLARTDRRPLHLYSQLEERGFTGATEEQPDGSFVTLIARAAR